MLVLDSVKFSEMYLNSLQFVNLFSILLKLLAVLVHVTLTSCHQYFLSFQICNIFSLHSELALSHHYLIFITPEMEGNNRQDFVLPLCILTELIVI